MIGRSFTVYAHCCPFPSLHPFGTNLAVSYAEKWLELAVALLFLAVANLIHPLSLPFFSPSRFPILFLFFSSELMMLTTNDFYLTHILGVVEFFLLFRLISHWVRAKCILGPQANTLFNP